MARKVINSKDLNALNRVKNVTEFRVRGLMIVIGVFCIALVLGFMCGLLVRIATQ